MSLKRLHGKHLGLTERLAEWSLTCESHTTHQAGMYITVQWAQRVDAAKQLLDGSSLGTPYAQRQRGIALCSRAGLGSGAGQVPC